MKNTIRILISLAVFFAGAALIPVMGLSTEGFRWQHYAGVYDVARLDINHSRGKPGSIFTIRGRNFTPGSNVSLTVNGTALGQVQASPSGDLLFLIDTTGADLGFYRVTASGIETAKTQFFLMADAPQWPAEDTGPTFLLIPGIALQVLYLPTIHK